MLSVVEMLMFSVKYHEEDSGIGICAVWNSSKRETERDTDFTALRGGRQGLVTDLHCLSYIRRLRYRSTSGSFPSLLSLPPFRKPSQTQILFLTVVSSSYKDLV